MTMQTVTRKHIELQVARDEVDRLVHNYRISSSENREYWRHKAIRAILDMRAIRIFWTVEYTEKEE